MLLGSDYNRTVDYSDYKVVSVMNSIKQDAVWKLS